VERAVDVLVEVERREHEHPGRILLLEQEAGRGDPVQLRHPYVHQDDIRLQLARQRHGLLAVSSLADDVDLRIGAQDHAEARADEPLVVGQEDRDHSGSRAATR